jgi:hypothetical protein
LRGGGFTFALELRKEGGLVGEIRERFLGEIFVVLLDDGAREEGLGFATPEVAGLAQDGAGREARLGIDPEVIVPEAVARTSRRRIRRAACGAGADGRGRSRLRVRWDAAGWSRR